MKYRCTNGTLSDGSSTYTCPPKSKNCYPDSYTYCRKLSATQKRKIIIGGVISVILSLIVSGILSRIPLIGELGALAINISLLLIIGVVVYIVYNNSKVNEKPNSYQHLYPLACNKEFYSNLNNVYTIACPMEN